ncbi:MAG: hypothetical protein LBL90_12345 [Prevotellaceae bacterium]|nr:hypothetical protein [Prevotellaceae bacterium]
MKKYIILVIISSVFGLSSIFAQSDEKIREFEKYLNEQNELVMKTYSESWFMLDVYLMDIKQRFENASERYDNEFANYLKEQNEIILKNLEESEGLLHAELNFLGEQYSHLNRSISKELNQQKQILKDFSEKQSILKGQLKMLLDKYKWIAKSSKDEYDYYLAQQSELILNTITSQQRSTLLVHLNSADKPVKTDSRVLLSVM